MFNTACQVYDNVHYTVRFRTPADILPAVTLIYQRVFLWHSHCQLPQTPGSVLRIRAVSDKSH